MEKRKFLQKVWLLASFIGIFIIYLFGIITIHANSLLVTGEEKTSNLTPFIWSVLIIGGSIVVVLSYVSWRKYKGQKRKKQRDKIID
ncbi:hypothetical protein D8M04_02795 [Oceanobacillus piezotolerans]|uniref:Uncharacterized protein n=1 Tax=Oceanobacillus piezotolerans TaxID=2448030 RepID=A0A498DME6_9BACI|nr:sporulation protein YpjB [Oceanobacillus piezotolerans]RLL48220.1 hypothetical protein D8M04_02795 [Oceanobacillus piezotolerans]